MCTGSEGMGSMVERARLDLKSHEVKKKKIDVGCKRCHLMVPEIGMPCENHLRYSCVPLGITSCTLYEPLCQTAFCCKDVCAFSVHFCYTVLVLFGDCTKLLKLLI